MINQCLSCQICGMSRARGELPVFAVGDMTSDILVIDDVAPKDAETSVMLFADSYSRSTNGVAYCAIRAFSDEMVVAGIKRISSVTGQRSFVYTWAQRCRNGGNIVEEFVDHCSPFTRWLSSNKRIIMSTADGLKQLGLPTGKKMFKTKLYVVISIKPLAEWSPADLVEYRSLFSKAVTEAEKS